MAGMTSPWRPLMTQRRQVALHETTGQGQTALEGWLTAGDGQQPQQPPAARRHGGSNVYCGDSIINWSFISSWAEAQNLIFTILLNTGWGP